MLVLSSATASSAVACGGDSDDSGSRKQATEPADSAMQGGAEPAGDDEPRSMDGLPDTDGPSDGNPVMTPDGEPMAVAEYGVAILPPSNTPPGPTMAMVDPPAPDPDLVPRPVYGAPALPPMPSATATPVDPPLPTGPDPIPMEPDPPVETDAGAPIAPVDAGAPTSDAAAEPEPFPEPEPMVQPAYGVGILPAD
jgi:hypothetical protein